MHLFSVSPPTVPPYQPDVTRYLKTLHYTLPTLRVVSSFSYLHLCVQAK
jgi:hypothetical protein